MTSINTIYIQYTREDELKAVSSHSLRKMITEKNKNNRAIIFAFIAAKVY